MIAILLVALNLRAAIASVPPLTDVIAADLGLSAPAVGLLTTLPVLCMGAFAPVGPLATQRFRLDRMVAVSVAFILAGTAMRIVENVHVLYASTLFAGVGIAVAGVLLPPIVRARFPSRVGPVTGAYTSVLIGGALLGASLTGPLHSGLGLSWGASLAVWCVPAVLGLTAWLLRAPPAPPTNATRTRWPWRDRRAWAATLFMGTQSLLFYTELAWLAPRYTAIGYGTATAGLLLGLFSLTQVFSAFAVPWMAHRLGRTGPLVALCLVPTTPVLLGLAYAPRSLAWVFVAVLGFGAGGLLALALTIVSGLGRDPGYTAAVSGMAFFVGYLISATGPVLGGVLRAATGGYEAVFASLAALSVVVLGLGLLAGRPERGHPSRP
ncbi:MFS transporter [Virgisporangium aliadipatigenens]|uniref:MFS transporter n=1 Tax=Virgisporangium aliadipatigenens TaxID=741659 RepID=A0A8J3YFV6_9ACTN|nr:MFS transporter [Virgisporangium aliadipatigenens]GIJ43268.1 MFS transporter [Virgisporangium aliadipatigenens]